MCDGMKSCVARKTWQYGVLGVTMPSFGVPALRRKTDLRAEGRKSSSPSHGGDEGEAQVKRNAGVNTDVSIPHRLAIGLRP